MSDKRRAEIEAKRAKLAELRKARADRLKADTEKRATEIGPVRKDLDEFINTLVGSPTRINRDNGDRSPSIPGTPSLGYSIGLPGPSALSMSGSGRASRQSDFSVSLGTTLGLQNSSTEHVIERELIDVQHELFEFPRKDRVTYNKEIQTNPIEVEAPDEYEDEIRQRITWEREIEADRLARDKELEEESVKLDLEIEQEIRELSEEERTSILAAPEFLDFVEQSSKIVQRALNDGYDYIRDYTIGTETGGDDSEGRVKRLCEFYDERYGKNRSITDVDWSPKYPELSVASYNKNPAALNEPDGIVAVWNLHLLERPEFVFHSQSDVLSVTFSPFHSNLVFGGTYSGQILLWDTRSKHLPVLKTPLSAAGHTHPVYAVQMVGTQNAHNLITSSTDGTVCSWLVDMLAQPQETLELVHAGHNKTGEVAITTLDFPDNETTTFWVGTEEGSVYQANRYDRAGAKAGLNQYDVYKGHAGPVMGLHFHPLVGPVDFSDLFLTSSVDWTVKLWRAKSLAKPSTTSHAIGPIYSFDESDDYVYDVRWHPAHPAVFGTVDGSGHFDLWNLNTDTEVPIVSTNVGSGRAINKLQWDHKDGRRAALGGSDGRLYIYDIGDMAIPRESEWTDMQKTVAGIVGGGQSNENGAPTHPVALLPSLRSAHLTTSNCDIIQACLSLSNKLNRLDLDLGFKSKDSQSRNGYIYQYLQEVVRIAPGLQHLNIRGSIAENLLGLVSSMKNLHSLSLRLGSSLTTDVLVAVATFPNLSELEIHAGHLNPRNLSDTLRDSVLPTFPSLKVLRMRAHAPVLDVILAAILPDTLHTLRIEAEDPSGVPVAWNAIFANISCKAANTLQNLTIEHHLELDEMAIDDVTPSTDTTGSPAGPGEPKTDTPIPVNDLHVLRSLRHLKQFTLDTTLPPSLSDDDLDKMFNAWPQLENLDLGVSQASTPSRPREKAQSPTLLSLHALARRAPKLTTLITPMDIGNVAANAVPGDITPQHALTRMTLGCMPPSNKTDEVAKHLFRLFPSLAHLDGHPELEEGWGRIRHGLRSASAAL
ncbi:hypothetical protein H0H81_003180 [Sphagnurus paluster]|uniref:Cytoplasmic dynein 1 intermediate chain 2 n=1 Tax=Sphagnurus paluster TaxID=117069 RepID=A0A9P7FWV3_9AGAR|nr:hypothetical protein H0H81_003180 [Sphagnurus paluster]